MNEDISRKLAHSTVKHVPMLLDEQKLSDFFLSTTIGIPSPITFLEEPVIREEKNSLDSYCLFYPVLLIRNDAMNYVPQTMLEFWNPFKKHQYKPLDLVKNIQSEEIYVIMINTAGSYPNSGLSVLGMLETVDFSSDCYNKNKNEKRVVKPQLIIPGFETSTVIKNWEESKAQTYTNKKSIMGF